VGVADEQVIGDQPLRPAAEAEQDLDRGRDGGEPGTEGAGRRRGRPPALAPDEERRAILDATLRVLRRSGYDRATLDEVLTEAGLSTRAFYRHYSSKDELLVALYEQEVASVATRLTRLVAASADPVDAVRAWVDDVLAIRFDPRRAQRAGLLRSREAQRGANWEDIRRATGRAITESLTSALVAGRASGAFPATDPVLDASTIHDVTFGLFEDLAEDPITITREQAVAHVLRFVLPALGAEPPAR
jgi:AcrR family transcriptional regulator